MKQEISDWLEDLYSIVGIDHPENHTKIVAFIANDVEETADSENHHCGDFAISFRRFLDSI